MRENAGQNNSEYGHFLCSYFFKVSFRFQPKVCDGCHGLMQKATTFNDVAIASLKGND